jgi:hypothetical protein
MNASCTICILLHLAIALITMRSDDASFRYTLLHTTMPRYFTRLTP